MHIYTEKITKHLQIFKKSVIIIKSKIFKYSDSMTKNKAAASRQNGVYHV